MVSNKFDQPYQKNIPDLFTELYFQFQKLEQHDLRTRDQQD